MKKDPEDKLINFIEEEIYLATGKKPKEHFSGDCNMNKILELFRNEYKSGYNDCLKDEGKVGERWIHKYL